ncbi:hypothetical protein [Streptomyces sp. NPDC048002]|uniref:hypothetical protein n=1 Tax=unclassified Streptomyces TaxID=2593676 RepID=UPI0033C8B45D
MVRHHKANKEVEGDPDTGHSRGLPRRPDDELLEQMTAQERESVGLPRESGASADGRPY